MSHDRQYINGYTGVYIRRYTHSNTGIYNRARRMAGIQRSAICGDIMKTKTQRKEPNNKEIALKTLNEWLAKDTDNQFALGMKAVIERNLNISRTVVDEVNYHYGKGTRQ